MKFTELALRAMLGTAGCALLFASCAQEAEQNIPEETTVITVSLPDDGVKTSLGPSVEGRRKVYWTDGDVMSLNGTPSSPLSGVTASQTSATFTFPGAIGTPYSLLYPATFYKDAGTITLPAEQTFASGTFAPLTEPMAGYADTDGDVTLNHLCSMILLQIKKDAGVSASNITSVTFRGNSGEQVCGDFTIDYPTGTLTGASSDDTDKSVSMTLSQPLSESEALEIILVVPARTYSGGFTIEIEDNMHRKMTKSKSSSATLNAGKLVKMSEFTFVPGALTTEFDIQDVTDEVLPFDGYNITGRVVDNSGNPLEGVVVSDGTKCVRTMFDGSFYLTSEIANVKFVHVSTPSGYKPQVVNGIPKFYKAKADITPSAAGVYDFGDYVLTPLSHPNNITLLVTADPQPRARNVTWDNIAYRSLDICQDLYQELYDVSHPITDREVYGICLGDIVHENMDLFENYNSALELLEYPTYNIIGNHDNDPSAADDDAGAARFESYYGPRNYSFNLSGIHFVMLDNLIMKIHETRGDLTAFDQGLTDGVWAWLQADLAMIPTNTTLCVCAHSPMFKMIRGSERSRDDKALHGSDYGDLINNYKEIHAWAGHTHVGFNYIYPTEHRHKRVQVHTLARSTGELWTNDYLAAGTPRGFTIVEIDNGSITWKFHPVTRQRGSFYGTTFGYCSAGAPAYTWRDWDYNISSGVAEMRDGSGYLTEDYQLHAYPGGAYGDEYVYANVFLWDEKWELPVWKPDGGSPVTMTRINAPDSDHSVGMEKVYDLADTEFRTWYKTYANKEGADLSKSSSYYTRESEENDGYLTTIFRAPASASPTSGTVSVTDRFGNTYSRRVSW